MVDTVSSRIGLGSNGVLIRWFVLMLLCCTSALSQAQQTPTLPGGNRPTPNLGGRIAGSQEEPKKEESLRGDKASEPGADAAGGEEPGGGGAASKQTGGAAPNIRVLGGGGAGGAAATAAPVTAGGTGAYEPFKQRPLVYDEVPDVGDVLSLTGPMPALQFLDDISFATGWNIVASPLVSAVQLQFWITDMKPKVALEILKFHDVYYQFDDETNILFVMTEMEYYAREYGDVVQAEFRVEHADVADIEAMVGSFLSPLGRLLIDPRTGILFVFDTQDNVDAIKDVLLQLDVPLVPKTYHLRYIDAEVLADSIESFLTDRGTVQIDPRTNTLVVTDLPARQDQIGEMVDTLDRELVTKTWTIKYADVEALSENIEVLIPEEMGTITINEDTHLLTVTAIPERIEEVDKLVTEWDIKRQQVQIEAYLVSANSRIARKLGIDWSYFGEVGNTLISTQFASALTGATDVNVGQLPSPVPLTDPITGAVIEDINGDPILRTFKGDNVSAVLHYLDTKGDVTILSQPRVTVQDGEEAGFENTESIPYVSSSYETPRARLDEQGDRVYDYRTNNQITFLDVGTILKVLPRISEEQNILLEISAEESTAEIITITASDEDNSVPQKRQNKAETLVRVHDGQTIVIGGLRQATVNDSVNKIPILGDIPIIKHAFRTKSRDNNNNELMIFITCTIVSEFTQPEAERLATWNSTTANELRKDGRPFWERLVESVSQGNKEIGVSIGQGGDLWSHGEKVTMEDLERAFMEIGEKSSVRVVIFKHPRAPEAVSLEVAELAMQADLKVEYDSRVSPFVPNYGGPIAPVKKAAAAIAPETTKNAP